MTEAVKPWWESVWKKNDAGTDWYISMPGWEKTKETLYEELRQCGIEVVADTYEDEADKESYGRILVLKFPSGKEIAIVVDGDYCGGHWMGCVEKDDITD